MSLFRVQCVLLKQDVADRLFKTALWILLFYWLPAGAFGQPARLQWVETTVNVASNGMAVVQYAVRWHCQGANLHGFYFEGFQEQPQFDLERCYALDLSDNKTPLEVKRLSASKYDIILAQGKSFANGDITYFFEYGADLRASGQVALTEAAGQKLAVFHWAPVQWDAPLEHQTVVLRLPIGLEQAVDSNTLSRIQFKTERFVNDRYRIDYPETRNAGKERIFAVRFHKENAEVRHHFRIQCYWDASFFDFSRPGTEVPVESPGPAIERAEPQTAPIPSSPGVARPVVPPGNYGIATEHYTLVPSGVLIFLVTGALIFIFVPLFIMTGKHKSMLRAREGIDRASWENEEWVPPKLQLGAFRTPGKICQDLTSLEIGVLMDLKSSQVLALMLENLKRKQLLSVVSTDPLRITASGQPSEDPYENLVLNSIAADGSLTPDALRKAYGAIVAGLEQKMWNCDPAATREHYRKQVKAARAPHVSDWYYWNGFGYFGDAFDGDSEPYRNAAALAAQMDVETPDLSQNLSGIKSAESCYDGPFVPNAFHDACHSACHDACHSACHSACHDACHSACVGGGSH